MSYMTIGGFPPQQLPFSKKTKAWRKQVVDFGDQHSLLHHNGARKSWYNMMINYDLINGKIHMSDLKAVVNPFSLDASFIPNSIQHYSVINPKLNVLRGEESERLFDPRLVVTNPTAISEMEEEKNRQVNIRLQQMLMDTNQSEEDYQTELQKVSDYFQYEYQDKREIRGNMFLNHYIRELEFPQKFNKGFVDAYTVGEEIYQCDIIGGEPTFEKIKPQELGIIRSGDSDRIEDADMLILQRYKSPGWVIDTYWDQLSPKDIKRIEEGSNGEYSGWKDSMDNIDARPGNPLLTVPCDWQAGDSYIAAGELFGDDSYNNITPYDLDGNVRVLTVYWKSRRKIKKVKSYDPETGEEQFNFYPETYHCDPMKGEEEQVFWVNEAWEGTKIAEDIYVNMRPRPVQYNRLSNPSCCHFGIIGSIYSINGDEPYSLVDAVKPNAYLYDIIRDKTIKLISRNMGKLAELDFAKVPKGWDIDKWMYFAMTNGIAVKDSFKEGNIGAATGKLAGALNNASTGAVDLSLGNEIQFHFNMLDWISNNVGELVGISRQREGQISNRETVGGVERATLQSSHITKWLFTIHDSVKKRAIECYLETAKIAYKGRKIKFNYLQPDGSRKLVEMDGDEFAECDYGLVVDCGNDVQELNQNLGQLAQAGLQNDKMNFSTLMKIYTTKSVAEKQRLIEHYEQRVEEQQRQAQQIQQQQFEQQLQQQAALEQAKMDREYQMHQEKLQAQILTAQINSAAEADRLALMNHDNDEANVIEREKMAEEARQFDKQLDFNREKLKEDTAVKKLQINKQNNSKK